MVLIDSESMITIQSYENGEITEKTMSIGEHIKRYTRDGKLPIVDLARHGHWYDVGSLSCRCSICGCKNNRETSYCPNCGAEMESPITVRKWNEGDQGMNYGALYKIEPQLNENGYTLGDQAEIGERLHFGINICYIHGIITDLERSKAFARLNKWIGKNAVKIKDGD